MLFIVSYAARSKVFGFFAILAKATVASPCCYVKVKCLDFVNLISKKDELSLSTWERALYSFLEFVKNVIQPFQLQLTTTATVKRNCYYNVI